jgi:hypothetical protein
MKKEKVQQKLQEVRGCSAVGRMPVYHMDGAGFNLCLHKTSMVAYTPRSQEEAAGGTELQSHSQPQRKLYVGLPSLRQTNAHVLKHGLLSCRVPVSFLILMLTFYLR